MISVIIPTVDRPGAAGKLARSLDRQTHRDFEVIVVDQSEQPDLELPQGAVRIPQRGLPNARNVGAARARGDVLLFIDDDEVPDERWIERHAYHYADPDVAGVAGRIRGGYDAPGGPTGRFGRWTLHIGRHFDSDVPAQVDHLPGGNFSVRREAYEAVGGFDVSYGGAALGEDTDFSLRLRAARRAGRFIYDPEAAVTHLRMEQGGCRAPSFSDWLYWHAHNVMLLALRHAAGPAIPLIVLARALRFGLFAIEHRDPALVAVGLHGLGAGASRHWKTRPR